MLRALRHYSSSVGVRVLYGLLALTFVAWGAGTMGMNRLRVAADVHGQRITTTDVDREAALLEQQFRQLTQGAAVPPGIDFRTQALDRLIVDTLLREEADRLGLGVSDDEIAATIMEMPELQQNGRFDRDMLERFLELQRDRGEFEADVRRRILAERLQGLIVDGLRPSDAAVRQEYDLLFAKQTLDFVRFAASEAETDVPVTDEALTAYVEQNRQRYIGPAKVRARYVTFSPDAYADAAQPSPSEIEDHYDAHLASDFTTPERVHARHILVRVAADAPEDVRATARARIEGLRAEIEGGADFEAVAKEHSDDGVSGAQGGDLGWFPRGKMHPTFEAAAFALEPGTLSDIVETPFGFHLIRVDTHDPGGPQALAEVRDEIVTELVRERGLDLARNDADAVRRAIVDGKSLADAAGDRPLVETEPFPRGSFVPGLGAAPRFNETAFALDDGQVSDLVEEDAAVYILTPFGRLEPAVPPLDEIRARVEADYRREKSADLAKERAEAFLAQAKEAGFEEAAKAANLEIESTGSFTRRDGAIPELGQVPDLLTTLSVLDGEQSLAPKVYTTGRDAVVVRLAERTPADESEFEAEKEALTDTIRQRMRTEAFQRYVDLLKQRAQNEGALTVHTDVLG